MSSTAKWIIGVVVLIIMVLGLWWSGVFGGSSSSTQSAAVTNVTSINNSVLADSVIDADVAGVDAQIKTIATNLGTVKTPTKSQISALAANFQTVTVALNNLSTKLSARIINANTSGIQVTTAQAARADLGRQLSNMTSHSSTAGVNAMASSSTSMTFQQSLTQLKSAQMYLQAARADVESILQGLAIK
jgi:hypothetical protein